YGDLEENVDKLITLVIRVIGTGDPFILEIHCKF
ncbi:unnamed protein product, partial [Choristocarpus tenellus]